MSPREFHLSTWLNRGEPVAESRMGCIGCSPIDGVHLLLVLLDGHIDEESRAGETCTAPNDVGRSPRVPSSGLCDDSLTFKGICEVGADIMESLLDKVCRIGLDDI